LAPVCRLCQPHDLPQEGEGGRDEPLDRHAPPDQGPEVPQDRRRHGDLHAADRGQARRQAGPNGYFDVKCFEAQASARAQYLKAGREVAIDGRLLFDRAPIIIRVSGSQVTEASVGPQTRRRRGGSAAR
jgi:hypothetical protein